MESSLCWKHFSGCVIFRIFPDPCFLLLLSHVFSFTLPCVQAPTYTHSFISCPHPTPYTVDILFLSSAWWKARVFHGPAQSSSHQACISWSHLFLYGVVALHPFLPFLLSWTHPVAPFPTCLCVCWGVPCPRAVQTLPAGKWGEGERSGGGSVRVFSCQPHKPSKYPALEPPPGDECRLNHAWKFPGNGSYCRMKSCYMSNPRKI